MARQNSPMGVLSERVRTLEHLEPAFLTFVDADPNGSLSAAKGTFAWDRVANRLYVNDDGVTSWTLAGSNTIRVRAYNDADVPLPSGALTVMPLNSERWDTANMHDNAVNNSRLTAPVDGLYTINGHCVIETGTGDRVLYIRLNGSIYIAEHSIDGTTALTTRGSIGTQYEMSAGDYVEFLVYQNSGLALIVASIAQYSPEFAMALL